MKLRHYLVALALAWSSASLADPIPVKYEIGTYSSGGYSASWMHRSTGCETTGPAGYTLYMCGRRTSLSGTISGLLMDSGLLQILGGTLNIGGNTHAVLDGYIGDFSDLTPGFAWHMRIQGFGQMLFEDIAMGAGKPNYFDGDTMILWGQNRAAYNCLPGDRSCGKRRGIDLYANRVEVAEPTTLALLGLGLLAVALIRRRQIKPSN